MGWMVDAAILGFLILQSFLGWRRGLLGQAAGVASLLFGVGLGLILAPNLGAYAMERVTTDPFHANLIGFLLVFGLVGLTLRIVAASVEVHSEKGLPKDERERRRAKDRILGGVLGALKGLVVAAILVAACVAFFPKCNAWRQSKLAGAMATAGSRLLPDGAVHEVTSWAKQHVSNLETPKE
jgi:uncharacterized membrane protein required for colicin V production